MDECQQGANEDQIQRLELQIGHKLPIDYREYLTRHNGQSFKYRSFFVPACQAEVNLDVLLGVEVDNNLLDSWKQFGQSIPSYLLAIGFDPGGNVILLKLTTGEVFYWDSELFFDQSSEELNTYFVAPSFSDFVNGLQCRREAQND